MHKLPLSSHCHCATRTLSASASAGERLSAGALLHRYAQIRGAPPCSSRSLASMILPPSTRQRALPPATSLPPRSPPAAAAARSSSLARPPPRPSTPAQPSSDRRYPTSGYPAPTLDPPGSRPPPSPTLLLRCGRRGAAVARVCTAPRTLLRSPVQHWATASTRHPPRRLPPALLMLLRARALFHSPATPVVATRQRGQTALEGAVHDVTSERGALHLRGERSTAAMQGGSV